MPLYVVTYTHPDEDGWSRHVAAHVQYLLSLVKQGRLRASGPFSDAPVKSAMLIIAAADRADLEALLAKDPFHAHGLVADQTVMEWDPIFGAFHAESSRAGDAWYRDGSGRLTGESEM